MQPYQWETLDDVAETIHAATGNCPTLLYTEGGMGACGDSDGQYIMALDTAEYPSISRQHKLLTVAEGREEAEVVLWGEGWSINCQDNATERCGEINGVISSATWVDLEPDEGFDINAVEQETSAPEEAAVPEEPSNNFIDGTHMVGSDIQAGTYRNDGSSDRCYWARLSGFGGTTADIIANDNPDGQAYVTIDPSDTAFESKRCGRWELVQ